MTVTFEQHCEMFAVKGWKVDASALKSQTEPFKRAAANGDEKQSRKRKRENAESAKESAKQDEVGKLWDEHIEGKAPVKSKKQLKKEEQKRQKLDPDSTATKEQVKVKPTVTNNDSAKQAEGGGAETKSKKRDRKKNKQKDAGGDGSEQEVNGSRSIPSAAAAAVPAKPPPVPAGAKLTPMQAAMRQKLISARFRHLNETLYTEQSTKALELFNQNPEMFEDYHSGFRQQVAIWPENPVDNFIATIRSRGKIRLQSQNKAFRGKKKQKDAPAEEFAIEARLNALPRTQGTSIIADLGCGDARLAQTLKESGDGAKLALKVLSYDLHSPSPLVTKADISNIPTADGSVDIAIFCLALMGTNWISFIEEAYRILHWKGELWIAEIKSRFGRVGRAAGKPVEHSVGGKRKQAAIQKAQEKKRQEQQEVNEQETLAVVVDGAETQTQETDVSAFVQVLKRRGFVLKNGDSSIDLSNKMFVKMEFVKAAAPTKGKNKPEEETTAKPVVERFKKAKFLDQKKKKDGEEDEELATDDEAKTLKPCVYKAR